MNENVDAALLESIADYKDDDSKAVIYIPEFTVESTLELTDALKTSELSGLFKSMGDDLVGITEASF